MGLVEREEQLNCLSDLFADITRGEGRIVIINGAVATGKTSLLHAFARQATGAGAIFLGAFASRAEQSLPLGVVEQLFRCAPFAAQAAEHVARLLDEGALAAALHQPDSTAPDETTARILHGLCVALLDLAGPAPLVIGVDDAHYADIFSLQCISYLARRVTSARVMIVLNQHTRPGPGHPALDAELLRQPHCRQLRLKPLSVDGVAALLAQYVDKARANELAPVTRSVSGGNPLLVHALIEDARMSFASDRVESVVGEAFDQAVVGCLHRDEPAMLDIARAIAVMDEPACAKTLASLLGWEPDAINRAVEALEQAGILQDGRFQHPRARTAVTNDMTADERAVLHAQVARMHHQAGSPATVVARHLMIARRVDEDWVGPLLSEAAEQALADNQIEFALACLRMAYNASGERRQRAAVKSMIAGVEWRVNPSATERHFPELIAAVREGHLTGGPAATLVHFLIWAGCLDEATDILDKVNASVAPGSDCEQELASTRAWLAHLYPRSTAWRSHHEDGGDPAPAKNPCNQLHAGSALDSILSHSREDALAKAEQVLQRSRLDDTTIGPLLAALSALVHADQDTASAWCDALLDEARARRAPTWEALFTNVRASIAVRQGKPRQAEENARVALTILSPKGWGIAVGAPLATMLSATTLLGKYDVANEYLKVPVPHAMFETSIGLSYVHARGRFYLATGRNHAALADFLFCGDLIDRWGLGRSPLFSWRADAAEAYLRLGEPAQTRRLLQEQLAMLVPGQARIHGLSLRLLAAASEVKMRPALLRAAVNVLRESGDQLELAQALADLSQAMHAVGESDRAKVLLRTADRLNRQCKAPTPLHSPPRPVNDLRTDRSPRKLTNSERISELSDAEHRVAALAAIGHTNREIARTLYITISTVEQHLTRAYRKLGVNRRTDLPPGEYFEFLDAKANWGSGAPSPRDATTE